MIEKGKQVAAHLLEAAEEDVVFDHGKFHVKGAPDKSKALGEVAFAAYGQLPAGKKFALSHWSATLGANKTSVASQAGHRQLCGDLSGEVVKAFVQQFPRTSAPEPGAA